MTLIDTTTRPTQQLHIELDHLGLSRFARWVYEGGWLRFSIHAGASTPTFEHICLLEDEDETATEIIEALREWHENESR